MPAWSHHAATSSSVWRDAFFGAAQMEGANLTGALMPDGEIHD